MHEVPVAERELLIACIYIYIYIVYICTRARAGSSTGRYTYSSSRFESACHSMRMQCPLQRAQFKIAIGAICRIQ